MPKGCSALTPRLLFLTAKRPLLGGPPVTSFSLSTPTKPGCPGPDRKSPQTHLSHRSGGAFQNGSSILPVRTERPSSLDPGVFPEPCKRSVRGLRAARVGVMEGEHLFLPIRDSGVCTVTGPQNHEPWALVWGCEVPDVWRYEKDAACCHRKNVGWNGLRCWATVVRRCIGHRSQCLDCCPHDAEVRTAMVLTCVMVWSPSAVAVIACQPHTAKWTEPGTRACGWFDWMRDPGS
ncbi:hypothetical protein K458DRAFT_404118 [Lentithecium fluviatile CBS 122367]|uniref:Uncharacterized protein n=1 Tax=Lentithecium fluviatile CBS 122367 TaxID=1168545 RepID=A0A6G1J2R3_9PLEO|nr:hypothetical protein K458DRAFT_404118 [Lentithecium fluviatile CBS 122367]